jgi:hypothetical protein
MNTPKSFDVIVAKEYETRQDGQVIKKTAWNRIGRAWPSKSYESISFELYHLPNLRYVIQLKDRPNTGRDPAGREQIPASKEV